jgi:hypothetical protein
MDAVYTGRQQLKTVVVLETVVCAYVAEVLM